MTARLGLFSRPDARTQQLLDVLQSNPSFQRVSAMEEKHLWQGFLLPEWGLMEGKYGLASMSVNIPIDLHKRYIRKIVSSRSFCDVLFENLKEKLSEKEIDDIYSVEVFWAAHGGAPSFTMRMYFVSGNEDSLGSLPVANSLIPFPQERNPHNEAGPAPLPQEGASSSKNNCAPLPAEDSDSNQNDPESQDTKTIRQANTMAATLLIFLNILYPAFEYCQRDSNALSDTEKLSLRGKIDYAVVYGKGTEIYAKMERVDQSNQS